MKKIFLKDARPDLAAQLVDRQLAETIGVSSKEKVKWRCSEGHEWEAVVNNRASKGQGCPYCSGRLPIEGVTDLETLRPDVAAMLVDRSLAKELKPASHRKVEWRCDNGHTWEAPVSHITNGHGCPYCSGRKAWAGETDIATLRPDLAEQLVDKSLASQLRPGSNKKVEWRCPDCGNVWEAAPNSRVTMKSGCPYCAGKRLIVGSNDLASARPDLVRELRNPSDADGLFVTSNVVLDWQCEKGHEWTTSLTNRVQFGHGCPFCAGMRPIVGETDLATKHPGLVKEMVCPEQAVGMAEFAHKKVLWRCEHGHEWEATVANRVQFGHGCPKCSAQAQTSEGEQELLEFVKQLFGSDVLVEPNNRTVLNGLEIDVFVPEKSVGFEFNGLYWHSSEDGSGRGMTHLEKMRIAKHQGVHLFVVWEDDWRDKRDLVCEQIRFACGFYEGGSLPDWLNGDVVVLDSGLCLEEAMVESGFVVKEHVTPCMMVFGSGTGNCRVAADDVADDASGRLLKSWSCGKTVFEKAK